jgi:hypothetical protein
VAVQRLNDVIARHLRHLFMLVLEGERYFGSGATARDTALEYVSCLDKCHRVVAQLVSVTQHRWRVRLRVSPGFFLTSRRLVFSRMAGQGRDQPRDPEHDPGQLIHQSHY